MSYKMYPAAGYLCIALALISAWSTAGEKQASIIQPHYNNTPYMGIFPSKSCDGHCYNGGTFNNSQCICPTGFETECCKFHFCNESVISDIVCEFSATYTIQCGILSTVNVEDNFNWGRTVPYTATPQCGTAREEDMSCYGGKSKIDETCQDKPSCNLTPSVDWFESDPCPGTNKYIDVNYRCMCTDCIKPEFCKTAECIDLEYRCTHCQNQTATETAYHLDLGTCYPNCNWLDHHCWPGTCDEGDNYLATSCQCTKGFDLVTTESEVPEYAASTKCELDQKPDIQTCFTRAVSFYNEVATSKTEGNTTECKSTKDGFLNFDIKSMMFVFTTSFELPEDPPNDTARHSYVADFAFGVTDAAVEVGIYNKSGEYSVIERLDSSDGWECYNASFDKDYPLSGMVIECEYNQSYDLSHLQNGEKICHNFEIEASGFVNIQDMMNQDYLPKRHYYNTMTTQREVCFHADYEAPSHCVLEGCTVDMLNLGPRIRRDRTLNVTFSGWFDPEPQSNVSNASGLSNYEIEFRDVLPAGNELVADFEAFQVNSSNGEPVIVELPERNITSMYAIYITAKDSTQEGPNFKMARRFVLTDNTSSVKTDRKNPIIVISATEESDYEWQTDRNPVELNWTRHFYNSFHRGKNLLLPIRQDNFTMGLFEQETGELPVSGTPNNDGVVNYWYKYHLISNNTDEVESGVLNVTNPLNQTVIVTDIDPLDGDWLNITIIAIDIMNNTVEDYSIVRIDSSGPEVRQMYLFKDGHKVLVHDNADLSTMNIQFQVYDEHSGMNQVSWKLGSEPDMDDVASGNLPVVRYNSPVANCSTCYCPVVFGLQCEDSAYSVSLDQVHENKSYSGNHNRQYYFTLTVENVAGLSTTEMMTILVDESPPVTGHVFDGPTGELDRDFQSDSHLYWHWTGFIDHESGISKYHIAVGNRCYTKKQLQYIFTKKDKMKGLVHFAETLHQSIFHMAHKTGFYQISVIAFNGAMEPSDVVCSSGLVYDNTPPIVYDVQLIGSFHQRSIICSGNHAWFLDITGISHELHRVPQCEQICSNNGHKNENKFPQNFLTNETSQNYVDEEESRFLCEIYPLYDSEKPVFLHSDNLHLIWNAYEPESQINDYFLKLNDRELRTTHNRTDYKCVNCGLEQIYNITLIAENKALLNESINIGQIIIDNTPPEYVEGGLNVSIDDTCVVLSWSFSAFNDPDYDVEITEYEWALGTLNNREEVVALTKLVFPYDYSSNHIHFELKVSNEIIQTHDQDHGNEYYFTIKAFNKANIYCMEQTDQFKIHSKVLPTAGIVEHVDPSDLLGEPISFQKDSDVLCIRWSGFHHYSEKLEYFVSIGSAPEKDDVYQTFQVPNTGIQCIRNILMHYNNVYFATVIASNNQGQANATSNGIYISTLKQIFEKSSMQVMGNCPDDLQYWVDIDPLEPDSSVLVYDIDIPSSSKTYITLLLLTDNGTESMSSLDVLYNNELIKATTWQYSSNNTKIYYQFIQMEDNTTISVQLYSDLKLLKALIYNCQIKTNIQAKTNSVSVRWFFDQPHTQHIDRYNVFLSEKGNTSTMSSYMEADFVLTVHRSMKHFQIYTICVSPCFSLTCLPKTLCEDFTVDTQEPRSSYIKASIDTKDDNLRDSHFYNLAAHWNTFKQGTETDMMSVNVYDWSLSTDEDGGGLLLPWTRIKIQNQNLIEINETVYLHPKKYKSMYFIVRAMGDNSKVKLLASLLQLLNLKPPSGVQVFDLPPDYDLDSIKQYLGSANLGMMTMELHNSDVDFTSNTERISGALLGISCDQYKWTIQNNIDKDCTIQQSTPCLSTKDTNENVITFTRLKLHDATNYTICVSGSENCPTFRACSNGFIIDTNPPFPGTVMLGYNHENGSTDGSAPFVTWNGFTDVEKDVDISYVSGINNFYLSIGSVPMGMDILTFTSVGMSDHYCVSNISLDNGRIYYATVKACDHVGLCTAVSSNVMYLDNSPPLIGSVNMYQRNLLGSEENGLFVRWKDIDDPDSGITAIEISVGMSEFGQDVMPFTEVDNNDFIIKYQTLLSDGHRYYANIKATNQVGLCSVKSALPIFYDSTPPEIGFVRHGTRNKPRGSYTTNDQSIQCHWGGFSDPHSAIFYYRVGVGTQPYKVDIVYWQDVGLNTDFKVDISLTHGLAYYITVEACNRVLLCSQAVSSALIADTTPPLPGKVHIGYSEEHEQYIYSRNSTSIRWIGFHDLQSDIADYFWCISTLSGLCDVLPLKSAHKSTHITEPDVDLPTNKTLRAIVFAVNNVDLNTSVVSKHFVVDTSHPIIVKEAIITTDASLKKNTQFDRSYISLKWEMTDYESPMATYIIAIHAHVYGISPITIHFENINSVTIPLTREHQLKDGHHYDIKVTGCNAAQLCSTSVAETLLVDSSPPVLGGFVEPLSWSEDKIFTYIKLSWQGFEDPHSGVNQYFITVSSLYSGFDLSDEIICVPHNLTEYVQTYTLNITHSLIIGDPIYLTIWAENNVGLKTDAAKIGANVSEEGSLSINKHSCPIQYCDNDCTCAAFNGDCTRVISSYDCKSSNGSNSNQLEVFNGLYNQPQVFTPSSACLSGFWISNYSSYDVTRFEWSVSIYNGEPGNGLINIHEDKLLFDVELYDRAVFCTKDDPSQPLLTEDMKYIYHVMAWHNFSEYTHFTSMGVTVDKSPPIINYGKHVLDMDASMEEEVEFTTDTSGIYAKWVNVFSDPQSGISNFLVAIGTSPGGNEIYGPRNLGLQTNISYTEAELQKGFHYYTTVYAYNTLGMVQSSCSKGFIVDLDIPYSGFVFTGENYVNNPYQSGGVLRFSWYGFVDQHSYVRSYHYAIMKNDILPTNSDFNSIDLKNQLIIPGDFEHGKVYNVYIKATDAAGHKSNVRKSNPITIDNTPPEILTCVNPHKIIISEEMNCEYEDEIHSVSVCKCMANVVRNTTVGTMYQVKVIAINNFGFVKAKLEFSDLVEWLLLERVNQSHYQHVTHYIETLGNVFIPKVYMEQNLNTSIRFIMAECEAEATIDFSKDMMRQWGRHGIFLNLPFYDAESCINSISIGLGTNPGGFQLQSLANIGNAKSFSKSLKLMHKSEIYTTIIVTNKAGKGANYSLDPLIIDWSPPQIHSLNVTIHQNNNIIARITNVQAAWEIVENESKITDCLWALGHRPGVFDVMEWSSTDSLNQASITLYDLTHGEVIYITVKCFNNLNMDSAKLSSPITVIFKPPDAQNAFVDIYPQQCTSFVPRNNTQFSGREIGFVYHGFEDVSGIDHYEYQIPDYDGKWEIANKQDFIYIDNMKLDNQEYGVHIRAVNTEGNYSKSISSKFVISDVQLVLTGVSIIASFDNNTSTLSLDWANVFNWNKEDNGNLVYEVYTGTKEGASDLKKAYKTIQTSLTVTSKRLTTPFTCHCVIVAVAPSGMYEQHVETINIQ